ncbi:MAG: class 3 adenylate cyclase [Bacteroidia bacterium]|jgi:class 3 adenylate cyclase
MTESRIIKVLVIEDDEFTAMIYKDQLSDVPNTTFDLDVYLLLNEGLEALKKNEYDVVLLDLNLPDSDYLSTIERIPEISYKLPVVIMTSANDELLALKTMNMGGQDYLVKNKLERNMFIRSVLYAIERHQLREQLQQEKEKSDALLRNILPQSIADELKEMGSIKARHYDEISVMFVDFVNFTGVSNEMNPEELVTELHTCFSAFDAITERLELEKIKTIGDAYMLAGGIPNAHPNDVEHVVQAAFEMSKYIEDRYQEKQAEGKPYWRARIGIHNGPVVAGVVGSKKFTYDIWGNTVNAAARMESESEPGRVNISESVYELIKNDTSYTFENRGKIEAKGIGQVQMWFVE